jgi:hypothetical protein
MAGAINSKELISYAVREHFIKKCPKIELVRYIT